MWDQSFPVDSQFIIFRPRTKDPWLFLEAFPENWTEDPSRAKRYDGPEAAWIVEQVEAMCIGAHQLPRYCKPLKRQGPQPLSAGARLN